MKSFVKINDIWREYNPNSPIEQTEIVGESGFVDITGLEVAQAEKINDLDWNDTLILSKKLRTGWLSPEGRFYGCEPWCHRLQAELIHERTERELEEEGWVRITYTPTQSGEKVMSAGFCSSDETIYPTSAQLSYLYRNYMDKKHIYHSMWNEASLRKEKIKREWGLGDE